MIDKKTLQAYISYGLSLGADELEIYISESTENSINVRAQEVEQMQAAMDKGLSVRIIKNKKFGFSYTTSLNDIDIKKTIAAALENTNYTSPDKFLNLPSARKQAKKISLNDFDLSLAKTTPAQLLKTVLSLEKAAYAVDKRIKKTESANISTTIAKSCLINSKGVYTVQQKTACGISLDIIAEENGQMEAASDYQYVTHFKNLKPKQIGEQAARKAIGMLRAGGIKTGKYDLLLTPYITTNFLSVLEGMFSADNIQKGQSLFKGKLQKKVASSSVTILNNPLLPKQLGSYLYDAEGVPAQTKTLIKSGVLKNYLYDTYTANKAKTKSTGNSSRGSLKAEPSIGTGNYYLAPGKKSSAKLLQGIKKGIMIQSVMGLHTADPISGDFSLGATGYLIESGKITSAIKDMAIAGNLIDILKSIKEIGSDLTFYGSSGAPSVVVSTVMVAGK